MRKKMKIKLSDTLLFVVWVIILLATITGGLSMISAANTIENIIGVFLIVIMFFVSYKTKCFLNIRNLWKKKDEENS